MRYKIEKMGEVVEGITIKGNPKYPEPEAFRIAFPWGDVEVVRARDNVQNPEYWVHVYVHNERHDAHLPLGVITDARLDQTDKSSGQENLGDFNRPELYHLAVKIGPRNGG